MGPITISTEQILVVVGVSSSITTAIFWGAYLIGKLMSRIERLEARVDDHDDAIRLVKSV
jgi:hypothetical protein